MEILNKPICQLCPEQALGTFRGKWICGKCLLKFEEKINQINNRTLDIIEGEISGSNQ